MNSNKTGLALGAVLGGWHFVWALLVAFGWAQPLLNFIFKIHMIQPVYVVSDFTLKRSAALVVITAVIGYVVGYVFSVVWNRIHR